MRHALEHYLARAEGHRQTAPARCKQVLDKAVLDAKESAASRGTCRGDSGGPIFSQDLGRVYGLTSRDLTPAGCAGKGVYTDLSSHLSVLQEWLTASLKGLPKDLLLPGLTRQGETQDRIFTAYRNLCETIVGLPGLRGFCAGQPTGAVERFGPESAPGWIQRVKGGLVDGQGALVLPP